VAKTNDTPSYGQRAPDAVTQPCHRLVRCTGSGSTRPAHPDEALWPLVSVEIRELCMMCIQ